MRTIYISIFLYMITFSGCLMPKSELKFDIKIPQNLSQAGDTTIDKQWWIGYGSSNLNELIDTALKNSPSIISAYEKIKQAKLLLQNSKNAYIPSIDLGASSSKQNKIDSNHNTTNMNSTNAALSLSYELDVWGKIAASNDVALANLNLNKYDFEALKLTLTADICTNYFEYLALNERAIVAKQNLEIAQKIYAITNSKYNNGLSDILDVSRQKQLLLVQESSLESLEALKKIKLNALAVLSGQISEDVKLNNESLDNIKTTDTSTIISSQILLNRPDIASALTQIESSRAYIDIARASKFPSFSLNTSAGVSSAALASLSNPASALVMGLNMSYNLFDNGTLQNQVEIERSKAQVAIQNYKNSSLNAFREVNDALTNTALAKKQIVCYEDILMEAKKSYEISKKKYEFGEIDLNSMLDTQKSYFNSKDSMITQKLTYLSSTTTLIKSLGGGWSKEDEQ